MRGTKSWASRHHRLVSALLVLASAAIASVLAEAVLDRCDCCTSAWRFKKLDQKRVAYYRSLGLPFDARSKYHFVYDRRGEGESIYPYVHPSNFLDQPLLVEGRPVFPLSGISRTDTAFCNERGEFQVYRADERGFHNPPGLWARDRFQVVLVGDSYTHGDCVGPGETIADRLRARFPHTLNLGSGGNGPLMELASLREHLSDRRFDRLVWIYCGNDLGNLDREFRQPILVRYLDDPDFSQGLGARQQAIDASLARLVDRDLGQYGALLPLRDFFVQRFPSLFGLLCRACRSPSRPADPAAIERRLARFERVMREARRFADSKGAAPLFVFLPTLFVDVERQTLTDVTEHREQVLRIVADLGIEAVDVTGPLLAQGGPAAIYPRGFPGHFGAAGYRVIAEQVAARLDAAADQGTGEATGDAAPRD